MEINYITYPYTSSRVSPNFEAKGKPLDLSYIYQYRRYLLPKRVEHAVSSLLSQGFNKRPSLMELHKSLYATLLKCETLEKAKIIYPEFKDILPEVKLQMNSVYAKKHGTTIDEQFVLKLLQEYWAKLRSKDEIAKDFGIKGRQTLDWTLEKIGFVGFDKNYRTILKASDAEGNKLIAEKTKEWNKANPEIRQQLNKHAAQGCKTESYIAAQRARMYQYDKDNPQRREKISKFSTEMWENCSDVKSALSEYTQNQPEYIRIIMAKERTHKKLSVREQRILGGFWQSFWLKHPELKTKMSEAADKVRNSK